MPSNLTAPVSALTFNPLTEQAKPVTLKVSTPKEVFPMTDHNHAELLEQLAEEYVKMLTEMKAR